MGEVHNAVPAARGHGISIRKDGGEEFLYLAPADSGMAFTKGQDRPHYQARLKDLSAMLSARIAFYSLDDSKTRPFCFTSSK
jgi:hypothetical protein